MRKLTVKQLRQKAYSYERQSLVPLDGQLQRSVQIGGMSTAAALLVSLFFTPVLSSWAATGFFWFLGEIAVGLLALLRTPVGIGGNVIVLLGFGLLWYMTDGLHVAELAWHQTAFGLAMAGTANLVIIGLPVLLIALNVVVWVAAIALVLVIGLAVLGIWAGLVR